MISFFLAVLLTIAVGVLRIKWLAMSAKFAKEGAK